MTDLKRPDDRYSVMKGIVLSSMTCCLTALTGNAADCKNAASAVRFSPTPPQTKLPTPAKSGPTQKPLKIPIPNGVDADDTGPDVPANLINPTPALPPPPPPSDESLIDARKVQSLIPEAVHAQFVDDKSYRLLVRSNDAAWARETDEHFSLTRGQVFLSPNRTVTIHTPKCRITLHDDSVVSIEVSAKFTRLLDFHDEWKDHVTIRSAAGKISLFPGHEVTVVNEIDKKRALTCVLQKPLHRRNVRLVYERHHLIAYDDEFSIPDALVRSDLFTFLKENDDAAVKAVIDDITKTAALLHITDSPNPYLLIEPQPEGQTTSKESGALRRTQRTTHRKN